MEQLERRAADIRAARLQQENQDKARAADRLSGQGGKQRVVGRVEAKLVSLGTLCGVVCGKWGDVSEDTKALVSALANSRVRVAGPSRCGALGQAEGEEGRGR